MSSTKAQTSSRNCSPRLEPPQATKRRSARGGGAPDSTSLPKVAEERTPPPPATFPAARLKASRSLRTSASDTETRRNCVTKPASVKERIANRTEWTHVCGGPPRTKGNRVATRGRPSRPITLFTCQNSPSLSRPRTLSPLRDPDAPVAPNGRSSIDAHRIRTLSIYVCLRVQDCTYS